MTPSKGTQQQIGQQGRALAPVPGQSVHPADIFKDRLKNQAGALALMIPRRVRAEFPPQRLIVTAIQAYKTMLAGLGNNTVPDIDSTIESVLRMAQLGLEVGLDQAYLVPYKGKVQAIIGPRGLTDLFLRHPKARACVARVVLTDDVPLFDYDLGTNFVSLKKSRSHPTAQSERASQVEFAYARHETTNGGVGLEVLTREDIEFYKSFSSAPNGPWKSNYEGMARKTALKRCLHYAPRDVFLSLALTQEGEDGSYSTSMSTEEIRDTIDASTGDGSASFAQVPQSPALPQKQTAPAAEQIQQQQGQSEPEVAPAGSYGDPAENFTR